MVHKVDLWTLIVSGDTDFTGQSTGAICVASIRDRGFKPGKECDWIILIFPVLEPRKTSDKRNRQTAKYEHKAFGWWLVACFHPVSGPCQASPHTGYQQTEADICTLTCSQGGSGGSCSGGKGWAGPGASPHTHTQRAQDTQLLCYETAAPVFLFFQ